MKASFHLLRATLSAILAYYFVYNVTGYYNGYNDYLRSSLSYDYRSHATGLRHKYDEMKTDFNAVQSDLKPLSKLLTLQEEMIKILEVSSEYLENVELSMGSHSDWYNRAPGSYHHDYHYYGDGYRGEYFDIETEARHNANLDIYVDLVFVGFPATALKVIKENWFDNLGRKDDFMMKAGPFGDILSSSSIDKGLNGETTISYHYNMVQISFQVADAIRNRAYLFSHNFQEYSEINAWEMEDTLDSLAKVITETHSKNVTRKTGVYASESETVSVSVLPTATIFILNLDLHEETTSSVQPKKSTIVGSNKRHKYRRGFNSEELKALAKVESVSTLSASVLAKAVHGETSEDIPGKPIDVLVTDILRKTNSTTNAKSPYRGYYDYNRHGETTTDLVDGINWRDAVAETRKWATTFEEETFDLAKGRPSIETKALRILNAPSNSILGAFKLELASSIQNIISSADSKRYEINTSTDKLESLATSTWIGGKNGILWKDMNAIEDILSNDAHKFAHSSGAVSPRPLSEMEWLKIGDHNPFSMNRDVKEEAKYLTSSMRRRYLTSSKLHKESNCAAWLPEELQSFASGTEHSTASEYVDSVVKYIAHQYNVQFTSDSCAYLSFELSFIDAVLNTALELIKVYENVLDKEDALEYKELVKESLLIMLKTLSTSIDFSNIYLDADSLSKTTNDQGETHVAMLSEDAVMYLSYLSGTVLDLTRRFIAPPMELQQHESLLGQSQRSKHLSQADLANSHTISETIAEATELLSDRMKAEFISQNHSKNKHVFNEWVDLYDFVVDAQKEIDNAVSAEFMLDGLSSEKNNMPSQSYVEGCSNDDPNHASQETTVDEIQELVHWSTAYPMIVAPSKIDVSVYVVKVQSAYSPLALFPGDQLGFDLTTFKTQVSRLALSNQEISISMHMILAQQEDDLAIGLHSCRRQLVDLNQSSSSSRGHYLNARCILSYIEHFDDEMYLNYADDIKAQQSSHPDFKQKHYKSTLHIPIYLLSVDSDEPIFVDGNRQVSNVGHSLIVMQNSQVQLPSSFSSTSDHHYLQGRNPIGPALSEISRLIGGLPLSHIGHRGTQTTLAALSSLHHLESRLHLFGEPVRSPSIVIEKKDFCSSASLRTTSDVGIISLHPSTLLDWTRATGNSPIFQIGQAKVPAFSGLDIEFIHRARVLRAITVARAITQVEIKAFYDREMARGIASQLKGSGASFDPILAEEIVNAFDHRFNNMIDQALYFASAKDWTNAIAFSNAIYFVAIYSADYLKVEVIDDNRSSDNNRDRAEEARTSEINKESAISSALPQILWSMFDLAVWPLISCGLAFAIVKLIIALMDSDWSSSLRRTRSSKSSASTRSSGSGWSPIGSASSTREPLQTVDNML